MTSFVRDLYNPADLLIEFRELYVSITTADAVMLTYLEASISVADTEIKRELGAKKPMVTLGILKYAKELSRDRDYSLASEKSLTLARSFGGKNALEFICENYFYPHSKIIFGDA